MHLLLFSLTEADNLNFDLLIMIVPCWQQFCEFQYETTTSSSVQPKVKNMNPMQHDKEAILFV